MFLPVAVAAAAMPESLLGNGIRSAFCREAMSKLICRSSSYLQKHKVWCVAVARVFAGVEIFEM
jgi:hypothetical protein